MATVIHTPPLASDWTPVDRSAIDLANEHESARAMADRFEGRPDGECATVVVVRSAEGDDVEESSRQHAEARKVAKAWATWEDR